MYLFEHLLVRLGKSGYAEAFVLKGGLLISSMTGVAQRTTMDMDTTVIGMDMDEGTVSEAVAAICAVDVADGMEYSFERIEPIREGDEYANWRAQPAREVRQDRRSREDRHHDRRRDSARAHRVPLPADVRGGLGQGALVPARNRVGRKARDCRFPGNRQHAWPRLLRHPHFAPFEGGRNKSGFPARSRCRHRLRARFTRTMGDYEAVLGEVRRSDMMRGI